MDVSGLQVDPDKLRQAADYYESAADRCAAARSDHPRAVAESESWGPLFHEARRAAVDAVNARERALMTEEAKNRQMADQLRRTAADFEAMNAQNAAKLTISTE
jgi:hypothetical protein